MARCVFVSFWPANFSNNYSVVLARSFLKQMSPLISSDYLKKRLLTSKSNPWNPIALCAICFWFGFLHSKSKKKNCLFLKEIKTKLNDQFVWHLVRFLRIQFENETFDTDFFFVYSNNLMKINRITLPKVQ